MDTKKVFSDNTAAVFRKKFYLFKVKGSRNILCGAKTLFSIFIFPKNRLAVHRFCEDKSCLEIETLFNYGATSSCSQNHGDRKSLF